MRLWQKLRNGQLNVDFRRQHPAGPFVLDFYCPALRLAVELDGGQHTEASQIGELHAAKMTPTRRWRADLPLSGGGRPSSRQH
jgi:very-short-patch-repair endonuclease